MTYETQTHFARHENLFTEVQKRLGKKDTPLEGLVIGAGMAKDPLLSLTRYMDGERSYAWEPWELLAVLRETQKDSRVSVMDISFEVCKKIREQKAFPVHDFFGTTPEYVQHMLEQFPYILLDEEDMNARLQEKQIRNCVTSAAAVIVSETPDVFCGDIFSVPEYGKKFDVVTALAVPVTQKDSDAFYKNVTSLVRKDGYLLVAGNEGRLHSDGFKRHGLEMVWNVFHPSREEYEEAYEALFQRVAP